MKANFEISPSPTFWNFGGGDWKKFKFCPVATYDCWQEKPSNQDANNIGLQNNNELIIF